MARKPVKAKKTPKVDYLVLTSRCGSHNQAQYYAHAATMAAAETSAEKAMKPDEYGEAPKGVYIVKIEKTGKPAGGVVWM